ncbi:alpha/beta-hydrolase [Xylariaceae sp. FL1019]|nr:alpha/beta-hydrolase [Xylariaceae sp. FL1019]
MSSSTLPTIVLVHGAWQTPPCYQKYIDGLQEAGFTVLCPLLPSCSGTSESLPPNKPSLLEDAKHIREHVRALIEKEGKRVLVIMHSYGGAVGSQALGDQSPDALGDQSPDALGDQSPDSQPLSFAKRRAQGLSGGVVHLLYLCAYMLEAGKTIIQITEETKKSEMLESYTTVDDHEKWIRADDPGFSYFTSSKVVNPNNEDVEHLRPHFVVWPISALSIPIQHAPWKHIPSSYVHTTNDVGVFTAYQEVMLKHAKDIGVKVKTTEYATYHFVWYSHLKEMVQEALDAASDPRNEA